jgi:hypothetical protein
MYFVPSNLVTPRKFYWRFHVIIKRYSKYVELTHNKDIVFLWSNKILHVLRKSAKKVNS